MTRGNRRGSVLLYAVGVMAAVGASGCIGCFATGDDEAASSAAGDSPASAETTVGTNVTGPLSALGALANLANDAQSLQAELATLEPVDPVHFSVLLDALPDAPSDAWTAGEPRGETNQMGDFSMAWPRTRSVGTTVPRLK